MLKRLGGIALILLNNLLMQKFISGHPCLIRQPPTLDLRLRIIVPDRVFSWLGGQTRRTLANAEEVGRALLVLGWAQRLSW